MDEPWAKLPSGKVIPATLVGWADPENEKAKSRESPPCDIRELVQVRVLIRGDDNNESSSSRGHHIQSESTQVVVLSLVPQWRWG
jgi:hypothetical protein